MTFFEVLGLSGITLILVWSPLFAWARRGFLKPLLTCAMCTGWWVGILGSLALRGIHAPDLPQSMIEAGAVSIAAHVLYLSARVLDTAWAKLESSLPPRN